VLGTRRLFWVMARRQGGKGGLVLDLGLQLGLDIGFWILDSWV
jgi:hypothetical protein